MKLQENEIVRVSVSHRCRLFGVSRQTFCHRQYDAQRVRGHSLLVLDLVLALRREIPGLGTRKLYLLSDVTYHIDWLLGKGLF